jgi:GTP-binding protein
MVDGQLGIDKNDDYIIKILRQSGKKIVLAANKLEFNNEMDYSIYSLGIDKVFLISAIHGQRIGDLLDEVTIDMKPSKQTNEEFQKLAIFGKPNAGKSSLLNMLTQSNRAIVSEIEGTTRDSVKTVFPIGDSKMEIIDTAGIKRKSKLEESVEHYALLRAFNSLEDADISLLIIDATKKLSHFDARIAGYAMDHNKPIIIVINKWDLIPKETNTMSNYKKYIRKEFKFLA